MFGWNDVRDYIFLFVNMYLLYYITERTRLHWESFHAQYHAAWALILINIGIQYLIEGDLTAGSIYFSGRAFLIIAMNNQACLTINCA